MTSAEQKILTLAAPPAPRFDTIAPRRAPSADPLQPYWIVIRMSRPDEVPKKNDKPGAAYRRHASEAAAIGEAERLAAAFPGKRFTVYASGVTFKVEKQAALAAPKPQGEAGKKVALFVKQQFSF